MRRFHPDFVRPENVATVVVVLRDPDASNEYAAWTTEQQDSVAVLDIDAGRDDLSNAQEYAAWAEHLNDLADHLQAEGWTEATEYVRGIVASYERPWNRPQEVG